MTLLSHNQLLDLVDQGVITNVKPEQINSSSIDITLGEHLLIEGLHPNHTTDLRNNDVIKLRERTPLFSYAYNMRSTGCTHILEPGEFVLAQSQQMFNLPDWISAEYKLKSSMARIGLEHLNAGWCDAGWNGSVLTLELKNMTRYHRIQLQEGDAIGQVVFFAHAPVPEDRSYAARGRYNNNTTVSGIRA